MASAMQARNPKMTSLRPIPGSGLEVWTSILPEIQIIFVAKRPGPA
jgi:hypothetical protein